MTTSRKPSRLPKPKQLACSLNIFKKKPFVVIALVDSGINPYHQDFRAPEFVHHPAKYIEGYPKEAEAFDLALDVADSKGYEAARKADDEEWVLTKAAELRWFPGTRIIGGISMGAGDTVEPWAERKILDDQDNDWWKTPGTRTDKETKNRDQLFARAMEDARWDLTAKLGKDIDTWSWGRLHTLTLKNQTLGTEGPGWLQWVLNRGPWKLGGGEATVNATGWNAAGGYGVIWVPSMRMVVNLKDLDKSRWINLTGASGHAYSDHYTDQTGKRSEEHTSELQSRC